MTEPTHKPATRRMRRAAMIAVPALMVVALAVVAMVSTGPATAHPQFGQPCGNSGCHTPTLTPAVTIATSKKAVKAKASITVTGKVAPGFAGLKARVQTSRNKTTWKTVKTVTLGAASTVSTTWKAPKAKGKYYFRLYYLGDNTYTAGASAAKLVTVK
jgi:hypothetical protein